MHAVLAGIHVVLDVAHHALISAFGAGAVRATGTRRETIMPGQVQKALVEAGFARGGVQQHRGLLVVDQHLIGRTAEVLEAAHQSFIGMLGIIGVGAPACPARRHGKWKRHE